MPNSTLPRFKSNLLLWFSSICFAVIAFNFGYWGIILALPFLTLAIPNSIVEEVLWVHPMEGAILLIPTLSASVFGLLHPVLGELFPTSISHLVATNVSKMPLFTSFGGIVEDRIVFSFIGGVIGFVLFLITYPFAKRQYFVRFVARKELLKSISKEDVKVSQPFRRAALVLGFAIVIGYFVYSPSEEFAQTRGTLIFLPVLRFLFWYIIAIFFQELLRVKLSKTEPISIASSVD